MQMKTKTEAEKSLIEKMGLKLGPPLTDEFPEDSNADENEDRN